MSEFQKRFPHTSASIEDGVRERLHLGAQLYVSRDLDTLADVALGESAPGRPLRPDDLMVWMSSTKPVAAVAIGQLWEKGRLELDDPVARHIPEFAAAGKESVTIRQILTHTAGIRILDVGWPGKSWDEILDRICRHRLEPRWTPGEKAGYHIASSWFVLGEIVRRLTGVSFSHWVRERIFEPAGMHSSWVGVPEAEFSKIEPRLAATYDCRSETPQAHKWTTQRMLVRANPARNGIGPAHDLGRFYEMLLSRGRGQDSRVLQPTTVEALTARHRVGMYDHTFQHVVDWGLGFIPDSKQYGEDTVPYGYGRFCSRETFGHSGFQSSAAFCDRRHGLVVALIFNGTPGADRHDARMRRTLEAIYADLGLNPPEARS